MTALESILDALIPSRKTARKLWQDNQRLESFLRAQPVEYCGWDQAGVQAVSPNFGAALGAKVVSTLADIEAVLDPGDAATLDTLFTRLQQDGTPFDISVHTVEGKTLRLLGKQGYAGDYSPVFSVLWLHDISDFARKAADSMEAVDAAGKRENELRDALSALPFPLWLRDERLDLAWCNKSYARAVDDTAAAVVAEQKELPLADAPRVTGQKAVGAQETQRARGHMVIGGQRRLIEVVETPVGGSGKTVGVALDVTREEEWEKTCKRLSDSHHAAMEQLRTGIAMYDGDTRLEFYNSAYEQTSGLSGAWLDTKPKLAEILDKLRETRKLPEQADFKLYKQQTIEHLTRLIEPFEEMLYVPDGTMIRLIAVPRATGGFLLTLEDVTSHFKLETSYNTLMAVQQETMDNLAEGVVVFGEDGRLKLSNQAFGKIWGIAPDALSTGLHISRLVEKMKPFFESGAWENLKQTLLGNGLEREPRRGRLERADGTVLEYAVMPLPDGNILNAYFDITDTVKVEQALLEKNAALQTAERLKTDFLANMSYQLRTPLNAIMGFAEMLQQQYFGKLNERQMEYTSSMIEAGQRLVSLVNDILDLSTIEAGYLGLYPAELRAKELLARVAHLTRDWASKQKIDIALSVPDETLVFTADERRVKQVLLNLISNAINYSPGGGTITLSAVREGEFVRIGVRDTGVGIPAEDMPSVFTPFERIQNRTAGRRSGAGLGLALVKNIVELHGGKAMIESKEGVGTFVSCLFPLHPAINTPKEISA